MSQMFLKNNIYWRRYVFTSNFQVCIQKNVVKCLKNQTTINVITLISQCFRCNKLQIFYQHELLLVFSFRADYLSNVIKLQSNGITSKTFDVTLQQFFSADITRQPIVYIKMCTSVKWSTLKIIIASSIKCE